MNLDSIYGNMAKNDNVSDFYKMQEGANRFRLLTDFVEVKTINRGTKYAGIVSESNQPLADDKVRTQGWAWAIVRGVKLPDGRVTEDEYKILQLGKTILGQIVELKNSPDYSFDSFPMPYDITVNAKGAGTKEVEYTVVPARMNSEVTDEEFKKLNKKKPVAEIVATITDKQAGKVSPAKETGFGAYEYPKGPEGDVGF